MLSEDVTGLKVDDLHFLLKGRLFSISGFRTCHPPEVHSAGAVIGLFPRPLATAYVGFLTKILVGWIVAWLLSPSQLEKATSKPCLYKSQALVGLAQVKLFNHKCTETKEYSARKTYPHKKSDCNSHFFNEVPDRQTDRYFIDRKKVNPDLFVIEIEICTCIYNIVNLLKSYDNIHSMTYITKIMLTGIAIRNTGYKT